MKELSVEDKAKRYDEALKVLHKYDGAHIMFTQDLKEEMFPELKESEDEKLREQVVYAINQLHVCECTKNKLLAWLEKQGEQKSDETEPKFKVGDWVVRGDTIAQILDIQEQYYVGLDINGNDFTSSKFLSDDKIHLWTIKDAKDGDVLVASDGSIFLFKCTIDCACKHYVALATDNVIKFNEGLEHYWETSRAVYPATKEQRDLLFQKMKEAGYKWDAEKKELKKISQEYPLTPDECIKPAWSKEWSEEDEAPEKIYINDFGSELSYDWHTKHCCESDIEYTRTDAFIENACVKLKKLMYDNLMFQGRLHREEVIETFVGDFRNYMEEEK